MCLNRQSPQQEGKKCDIYELKYLHFSNLKGPFKTFYFTLKNPLSPFFCIFQIPGNHDSLCVITLITYLQFAKYMPFLNLFTRFLYLDITILTSSVSYFKLIIAALLSLFLSWFHISAFHGFTTFWSDTFCSIPHVVNSAYVCVK